MEIVNRRLIFLIFVIVSGIFLSPTFGFALSGDDWLTLFRFKIGYTTFFDYFDFNNFRTNYDFANILMGLMYKIYQSNSFLFFLSSYLLKIILSISIYFFLNFIDRDRITNVLISSSILLLNAGGESVNWIFNMHVYIAIILLFFTLYSILNLKSIKRYFVIPILIFGCFLVSPTRMHGLIFVIPLMCWLVRSSKSNFLLSVTIYLLPVAIFRILNQAANDNFMALFSKDFSSYISFINSLIESIYNSVLPTYLNSFSTIYKFPLIMVFYYLVIRSPLKPVYKLLSVFPALFLIIPQLINYTNGFDTIHRYLLLPGIFMWIIVNKLLISLIKNKNLYAILFSLLILINGTSVYSYFNNLYINGRSSDATGYVYNQFISFSNSNRVDENTLFLFTSDNSFKQYNVIEFGLTPKLLFLESRYNSDITKAPNIVESTSSLVKLVNNNTNEIRRYGFENKIISLDNVYHLYISPENKLVDLTSNFRNSLSQNYDVNK